VFPITIFLMDSFCW